MVFCKDAFNLSQQGLKALDRYIAQLETRDGPLVHFDGRLWLESIDRATVYHDGRIVFRFIDGTEIPG